MKLYKYYILSLLALLSVSCTSDLDVPETRGSASTPAFTTSVTRYSEEKFEKDDPVGIYMLTANTTVELAHERYLVDATCTDLRPESAALKYPKEGKVDFHAYYPAVNELTEGKLSFNLSQKSFDLLYASAIGKSYGTELVTLDFHHQFSLLEFVINKDNNVTNEVGLKLKTIVDGSFSLLDGKLTEGKTTAELPVNDRKVIVVPTKEKAELVLTIGDVIRTVTLTDELAAGKHITISVNITGKDYTVTFGDIFVGEWTDEDADKIEIDLDGTANIPVSDRHEGFNFEPKIPQADKPLKITYVAGNNFALHGTEGDIYLHSGANADWKGAPDWNAPGEKFKAVRNTDNTWTIVLGPTLKDFYGLTEQDDFDYFTIMFHAQGGETGKLVKSVKKLETETLKASSPVQEEGITVNSATEATFMIYDQTTDGKHYAKAYYLCEKNNFKADDNYRMSYDEAKHCWWITVSDLTPGDNPFQYLFVDEAGSMVFTCDPYSEKVFEKHSKAGGFPEKAHGRYVSVVNTQPDDFTWTDSQFKAVNSERWVIYELLLRDFTSEGNVAGAIEKLDYLKELGVNAIELMPTQEFSGDDNWGYDTSFYFAMDRAYGETNDYKKLINACHNKGMAVILDVVYNHTNDNSPFVQMYYNPATGRPAANNPYINEWPPHKELQFGRDFNHESEKTRNFVDRNIKYLLDEYHLDGLRFDFTKGFTQTETWNMDDLNKYDDSRVNIIKHYNETVKNHKPGTAVIMEHFVDDEEGKLDYEGSGIRFWKNINKQFMQAAAAYKDNSDFGGLKTPYRVTFMESHDEERMGYFQLFCAQDDVKSSMENRMNLLGANACFCLLAPNIHMIWQFGEMGYDVSINENDRCGKKPIHWEYLEDKDRKQLHDLYAELLNIRNNNPDLFLNHDEYYTEYSCNHWNEGRSAKIRKGEKEIVILANYNGYEKDVHFIGGNGEWYNYDKKSKWNFHDGYHDYKLKPYSFAVFSRNLAK